jgi:voltage-gated potassium channel
VLWNLFIVICTLYAALRIPADVVLGIQSTVWLFSAHAVLTAVYLIDPIAHVLSARARGGNAEVKRYLRGWFIVDLAAVLPLLLPLPYHSWFRLMSLIKLVRVTQFITHWRRQLLRTANWLRLGYFAYGLVVIVHITACGWVWIRDVQHGIDPKSAYIPAVYWSVSTLATVGYGDITPQTHDEMVYAIAVMMVGFVMYGYLIGNIAGLLNNFDPLKQEHVASLDRLQSFIRYRHVPTSLQHRIIDYYAYMWEQGVGLDEATLLSKLPLGLRTEVSLFLKRGVIEQVPIFRNANDNLKRELANALHPSVVTPGEVVFKIGDHARHMYFISKGTLEVIDANENIVGDLHDGEFFGEMALLAKRRRMGTVRAKDYCELYLLDGSVFDHVIEHYPDFRAELETIVEQRMQDVAIATLAR